MLDMSWGEVMVIGAVALIVIGPKDLPRALRTVGQMTSKLRRMAAEFQGQFNEAIREAELDEVKQQLQGVNDSVSSLNKGFNPIQTIRDELKNAVETPVTPAAAVSQTGEATLPQAADQSAKTQTDPLTDWSIPPFPPAEDSAEVIAQSLRREAEAEAAKAAEASRAEVVAKNPSDAKAG